MRGTSGAIVDSKVVELQLDNSNFEQNASSTISTVQKLQEALDFSVSGKNFDNINASVKKVNFDPINQGIETAKNGFSALEAVAFGAFTNIGVKISNLGMRLVSAIPRQIIEGGKSRAFNMEQAKFQIDGLAESMEGMADAWDRIYKEADYAVGGTAYGLDVAAKAASQLMASGVAFGDTFDAGSGSSPMAKALRGISGVAAMSNSSYEEISSIFTKIAGQGRMMGEEINQIASRGLNASATIAQFINGENNMWDNASESVINYCKELSGGVAVTEADIREFASKGKISFELFSEAMDAAYGEHATKANETFTGSLTNIKAQLSKIGEVFASPLLANGQKVFSKLYEVIKDIRLIIADSAFVKGFENLANTVGDTLAGAFEKAHNFLRQFTKDSKKTKETQNAIETVAQIVDKKTGIGAKLREYFGISEVADEVEDDTKRINSSFESVKDTVIATIRGDFGNGLSRINALTEEGFDPETIQNYVNQLWELTGHDWSKLSDDIYAQVEAQGALGEVTAETSDKTKSGNKEIEQSMGPVEHVLSGLLNLWTGINNVVGIVREKIQGAMGAITGKGGALEKIAETFDNIAISFSTFTSEHGDEIAAVFDGIVNAVLLVIGVFGLAGQAIWNVVGGALEGLGTSLWDIVVWISNTITAIRNWITENKIVEKSLGAIKSVVSTVTGKIKDLWNAFTSLPFVKKSIDAFSKAFGFVGEQFSSITEKGGKVLGNFWSMLKNGFKYSADPKQMWENVKNSFSYLWNQIKSSEVIGKFGDAFNTVKTAISDYFIDLGKNEDGSLNTFGRLQNGFSKFFSGIGNSISQFREDGNLSSLFNNIKLSFQGLRNSITSSGLFDKIKAGFIAAKDTVIGFFDALGTNTDGSKNYFGKFLDTVSSWYETIKTKVNEGWNKAVNFFNEHGIGEFLSNTFNTLKDGFVTFFTSLPEFGSGLKSSFTDFLDKVTDIGGWKFKNFGDIWQAFKDTVWNYITTSDLFAPLVEAFTTAWENIKNKVWELGNNEDGTRNWFGKLTDTIVKIIGTIRQSLGTLRDGFGDFFKSLPSFFAGIIPKFQEFLDKVKELGGFKFENIGEIWQTFKDTVVQYFKDSEIFKPISDAFSKIKDDIKTKLKEAGVDVDGLKEKFQNFVASIKESWRDFKETGPIQALLNLFGGHEVEAASVKSEKTGSRLGNFFSNISEGFKDSGFGKVASTIGGFFAGIGKALLSIDPNTILKIVAAFAAFKIIKAVWNEIKGIIGSLVTSITGLWDAMAGEHKAKANAFKALTALELVAAVAAVGLVIKELASIEDFDKALQAAGMLGVVLAAIVAAMLIVNKFGDSGELLKIGAAMILVGAAISAVGLVINELAQLEDLNKAWEVLGMLGAVFGVMTIVLIAGSNLAPGAQAFGIAMLEIAGALLLSVAAMKLLENVDFVSLVKKLIDGLIEWNTAMDSLPPNGFNVLKSAVFLSELEGIAFVLGSVSIASFIEAVGSFVSQKYLGQGDLMGEFKSNVTSLVDAITIWNDGMDSLPPNGFNILKSAVFLAELMAINWVLKSTTLTGFLTGIADFILAQGKQEGSMSKFRHSVQDLVGAIIDWNDGMDSLPPNGFNILKSAVFLAELKAIDMVLRSTVLTGFLTGVSDFVLGLFGQGSTMGKFRKSVEDMVEAIKAWHDGIELVNPSLGEFGKSAAFLAELTAITWVLQSAVITTFFQSIGDFIDNALGGEGLMPKFKKDVQDMVEAVTYWQDNTKDIKPGINFSTMAINQLTSALDYVNSTEFWGKIGEFIHGGQDFTEDFKTNTLDLAEGIKNFTSGIADIDDEEINNSIKTINALARLAENLAYFVIDSGAYSSGDSNLTNFARALGDENIGLGHYLNQFIEQVPDTNSLSNIVTGFSSLVHSTKMLEEIDLSSGDIMDDEKVQTLRLNISKLSGAVFAASGAGALSLGTELFISAIDKLSSITITAGDITESGLVTIVIANVDKLKQMISGLSGLDTSGIDKFTGAIEKLNGVDMSNAAKKLQEAQSNVTVDTSSSADTGKQMTDAIAGGIESTGITSALNTALATAISGVDTSAFRSLGATLSGDVAAGISSGGRTIKSVFSTVMDSAISVASDSAEKASFSIKEALESVIPAIPSSISVTSFNSIGTDIIDQISKGLSKGGNIAADLKNIVKDAKSEAADYTNNFKEVGSNFVSGLASGINSNRSEAITAAANVAAEALRRAKQELDIHSPSRKMLEVGKFFVLGFANGITRFTTTAIDRAEKMADATSEALMMAVNAASDFLDNDDYQPVITPVLDLSNIEAGASRLDTMLDIPKTMGLNFGAIEHNAEAIRDQRSNADILDALERLGENMNNSVTGDTYNINGVTYDDGSNVADAVSRLVDAARIGRRA